MADVVKRRYDNSRRLAQVRATRLNVIEAATRLFVEHGYPATTIEAVADAADVALPTLYRLFGSKRALLKAVLDTSLGGDDEPIAFGDRPEQQEALAESDPISMVCSFAHICRQFMERSSEMFHVVSTAAQIDPEIAELQNEIRRQRHTGQSRIVAALAARNALDPELTLSDAEDIAYAALSPEVHRILTIDRRWTADQYEHWLTRVLSSLLRPQLVRRRRLGTGRSVRAHQRQRPQDAALRIRRSVCSRTGPPVTERIGRQCRRAICARISPAGYLLASRSPLSPAPQLPGLPRPAGPFPALARQGRPPPRDSPPR